MHIEVHMYTLILSKTVVGHFPERRKLFGQSECPTISAREIVRMTSTPGNNSDNLECGDRGAPRLSEKFPPFRKVSDHCFRKY